jgi:hypothetical protein
MIRKETVFILGAGASIPYGFPSGKTLVKEIIKDSRNETSSFSQMFSQGRRLEFSNALDLSFAPSIDDLLEKRPEFMDIGKTAISIQLIQREDPSSISRETMGNWYELLWECMQAKVDDFVKNQVSFITFNYDRSLEFFLQRALMNYYGIQRDKANEIIDEISIIHIHGMLGAFKEGQPFYRDYNPQITPETIETSVKMIHVFHENSMNTDEMVKKTDTLLGSANVICFLGFGYHPVNIQRIGVSKYTPQTMYGSVYQMGDAEIMRVRSTLGRLNTGSSAHDCLRFLREVFMPE